MAIQKFFNNIYKEEAHFQAPNTYYCLERNSIRLKTDPYTGLHIEIGHNTRIPDTLTAEIEKLCALIPTTQFQSLWVDMATDLPQLALDGFTRFKDYNKWRAFRWLSREPCTIPVGVPNFTVTALILDKTYNKILLIKDIRWRAPQGIFDLEEDDPTCSLDTLHRVVKLEAGIDLLDKEGSLLVGLPRQNIWEMEYDQGSLYREEYQTGVWVDINALFAGIFEGHPIDPGLKNLIPQDENQNIHKKIKLGDD